MNMIITNSITIIFVAITLLYAIKNIILNNSVYNFIKEEYKKVDEECLLNYTYLKIKQKHNTYIKDTKNIELDVTSFMEEESTNYKYKKQSIILIIRKVKKASSICILLGVLGTFVGLSILLLTIQSDDIIKVIPNAISSMQTSFITSVFGIVCSILINYFIDNRDCDLVFTQLIMKLENLLNAEIANEKNTLKNNKLNNIELNLIEINKAVGSLGTFQHISVEVNKFNNTFIHGVDCLNDILDKSIISFNSFENNISKLDKQFSILNIKLSKVSEVIENQDRINKEILFDLKETTKTISETTEVNYKVKNYIKNINDTIAQYDKNINRIMHILMENEQHFNGIKNNLYKENSEEIYEIEGLFKENISEINGDEFSNV